MGSRAIRSSIRATAAEGLEAPPRGYSYLYANRDTSGAETLAVIPHDYPLATRSPYVSPDLGF